MREEGLALARAEFAVNVSAGVSAPEGLDQVTASGPPEGVTGLWRGDPVVAAGASGEVAPGGIEPQAGEFDMDAFLVDRGYEAPAPPAGEGDGVVAVEPMAVSGAGDVGAPVPEAEGVQENPGVVGGGFHDGGFGPVDVEEGMEPTAAGGGIWGPGPLMKGRMGLLREVRRSLWLSKTLVSAMPARVF